VDTLAAQIRRLVEAALGAARLNDPDDCLDEGPLRRRPLRGQVEAGRLGERPPVELLDPHGHTRGEQAAARGPSHLDARDRRVTSLVGECASV
jgi:hypothetical protein